MSLSTTSSMYYTSTGKHFGKRFSVCRHNHSLKEAGPCFRLTLLVLPDDEGVHFLRDGTSLLSLLVTSCFRLEKALDWGTNERLRRRTVFLFQRCRKQRFSNLVVSPAFQWSHPAPRQYVPAYPLLLLPLRRRVTYQALEYLPSVHSAIFYLSGPDDYPRRSQGTSLQMLPKARS
jgi:hypothetical protein